jgi:hypothetical protein
MWHSQARRRLLAGGFSVALAISFLAPNPIEAIVLSMFGVMGVYMIAWGVVHWDGAALRPAKHRHTFGNWNTAWYKNDNGTKAGIAEQVRTCTECGYAETRNP